jgi:site-specific recombinase XerD
LRVWQPACESVGLATITSTTIVKDGKRKTKRTYDGSAPYDLRHSFASLLIHEGRHSIVQIAEWMGHGHSCRCGGVVSRMPQADGITC